MHTHLHPVFEGILNNFAIPQTAAMDSYRRNLARHDWHPPHLAAEARDLVAV